MNDTRKVTVHQDAVNAAIKFGWPKEDAIERLERMAVRSAPTTHWEGNRRFDHFILNIRDGVLLGIHDTRRVAHGL